MHARRYFLPAILQKLTTALRAATSCERTLVVSNTFDCRLKIRFLCVH